MSGETGEIRPPELVIAREHLEEVVQDLRRFPVLGFDTESNGFYAYKERVCLIQISSPEADYVVDPIAVADISSLGPVFADPGIVKIFHAAEYDLIGLKRDYKFEVSGIFDTMIAGRFLGWKELGLAKAVQGQFGVTLSKKLQKADWGRRPLSAEHLRYAQMDTHFLIALSEIQRKLLAERDRWEDAAEAFKELEKTQAQEKTFDPDGYRSFSGSREFSGEQRSCLKELYLLRERESARRDQAPFRVLSEELMLRLAAEEPRDKESLARIKGVTPYLAERLGGKILGAISRGRENPPIADEPRHPPRERRDLRQERLFEKLRQWRKSRAEADGLDPGIILSASVLRGMARAALSKEDPLALLSPLKRERYGEALRQVLGT